MKKNKKIWSYALACALAMSNLSVVAAPFSGIVALAADDATSNPAPGSLDNKLTITLAAGDTDFAKGGSVVKADLAAIGVDIKAGSSITMKASGSSGKAQSLTVQTGKDIIATGTAGDDATIELNGQITTRTDVPETVTVTVECDLDGSASTTNDISVVATKTFEVRQHVTVADMKKIASLQGNATAYNSQATELTLNLDESALPAGYYMPEIGAAQYFVDLTDDVVNTTSGAALDTGTATSLAATNGQLYNKTTPPKAIVTAPSAGKAIVELHYNPSGNASHANDVIATKEITISKSDISGLTVSKTSTAGSLISTEGKSYVEGGDKLEFEATETYNFISAASEIKWGIWAASDSNYSKTTNVSNTTVDGTAGSGKFTIVEPTSIGTLDTTKNATSFKEKASVTVSTAAVADAGKYSLVAYIEDATDSSKKAIISKSDFELIGYNAPIIWDDLTDAAATATSPEEIGVGDSVQLSLYVNDEYKTTGVTWALKDSKDSEYVTLQNGKVTVKKHKAGSTVDITAVYAYNSDIKSKATIATANYAVSTKNAALTIKGSTNLKVGEKTKYTATFGGESVSNVVWTVDDTSLASIGKSTGDLEALKKGAITVKASTTIDKVTYTKTLNVNIHELPQVIVDQNGKAIPDTDSDGGGSGSSDIADITVYAGKTLNFALYEDGKPYTGKFVWVSSDKNVAEVDQDGTVHVSAKAQVNDTTTITAELADGTPLGTIVDGVDYTCGVELTVAAATYEVTSSHKNFASNSIDVYLGDTFDLNVTLKEEAVDGFWNNFADGTSVVTIKGNKVTANKVGTATTLKFYLPDDKTMSTPKASVVVTVIADAFNVESDDIKLAVGPSGGSGGSISNPDYVITSIEQGMSYSIKGMYGLENVTSKATWKSTNSNIVSVDDGVITGAGIGNNAVITATYDGTSKFIKINRVSAMDETTAAANEAAEEANAAAEKAEAAAKAAEANPTAETVAAAKAAAEAASAAAEKAEAAAKATSNAAAKKAAEEAAKAATDAAKTATDAATAAQAKIDEAAKKSEEEKKAAEEAAKKSDGSEPNKPAPVNNELKDPTTGATTGYVVTNATAGQATVEYKGNDADKKAKSVTIPDTVKDASGNEYKVTSIAAKAFAGADTKTVTIGKNIKKIDPNAFKSSKVKKVIVKGTKFTKKMAKAINKLKKGSTVKVTGKNKKANKKIFNALKNVKNGKIKVK